MLYGFRGNLGDSGFFRSTSKFLHSRIKLVSNWVYSLLKVEMPNSHEAIIVFEIESTLINSLIKRGSELIFIVYRRPFIQMYVISHMLG